MDACITSTDSRLSMQYKALKYFVQPHTSPIRQHQTCAKYIVSLTIPGIIVPAEYVPTGI